MRPIVRTSKHEQHLYQINADLLKQMTELEMLREAVRLAEAGKPPRVADRRLLMPHGQSGLVLSEGRSIKKSSRLLPA